MFWKNKYIITTFLPSLQWNKVAFKRLIIEFKGCKTALLNKIAYLSTQDSFQKLLNSDLLVSTSEDNLLIYFVILENMIVIVVCFFLLKSLISL